jgi:polar amino acid transport system substrate-binding protein
VNIGIDLAIPPYGTTDANMQPAGFDVDMAKLIAKDLGEKLNIVPVTGPNRVAYLLTKKVDMIISTFSVTPERAKSVAFTDPYGANVVVAAGRKGETLNSTADLAGKAIAVVRGTIQDTDVTQLAPKGATIRRYDDDATAAAAILSGQVDVIVTGQQIAQSLVDRDPSKTLQIKLVMGLSPYSIGIRPGDPDLLHWLNTAIYYHRLNGDLQAMYQKWIGGNMPPLPTF